MSQPWMGDLDGSGHADNGVWLGVLSSVQRSPRSMARVDPELGEQAGFGYRSTTRCSVSV
jgi:hypothetical protein